MMPWRLPLLSEMKARACAGHPPLAQWRLLWWLLLGRLLLGPLLLFRLLPRLLHERPNKRLLLWLQPIDFPH